MIYVTIDAVTALITHGIINPALCSRYLHINIHTFLHNKSTGYLPDAFFSVSYDYLLIFGVLVFLVLRLRRGDIVRHRER